MSRWWRVCNEVPLLPSIWMEPEWFRRPFTPSHLPSWPPRPPLATPSPSATLESIEAISNRCATTPLLWDFELRILRGNSQYAGQAYCWRMLLHDPFLHLFRDYSRTLLTSNPRWSRKVRSLISVLLSDLESQWAISFGMVCTTTSVENRLYLCSTKADWPRISRTSGPPSRSLLRKAGGEATGSFRTRLCTTFARGIITETLAKIISWRSEGHGREGAVVIKKISRIRDCTEARWIYLDWNSVLGEMPAGFSHRSNFIFDCGPWLPLLCHLRPQRSISWLDLSSAQ